jgi:hypothetical protein
MPEQMRGLRMPINLIYMRRMLPLLMLLWSGLIPVQCQPTALTPPQAQALVERALATELRTAQDPAHPMRYRLRKTSPRLTSTKEILETKDGDVAHLVALFDKPLNAEDEQKEQARLDALFGDPSLQKHRKQGEQGDMGIVLKLLRMLPNAFHYEYAGSGIGPAGSLEKFSFRPNPNFSPPDFETQALTNLTGELWIDAAQERVTHLEGHLQQDTAYLWGVLGKLDKGGSVVIEQADVGDHQWRIARFKMRMNLRILFKTKNIDTAEEMTEYTPVSTGIDYRKAIEMLRATSPAPAKPGH